MFQPAIPLSGYGGWKFLQSTYTRQLENFADSPQIRNDRDYMVNKLSEPISTEAFLDDRRLLRVTMTAFGLAGEEWKRGFVEKALDEAADPDSNFFQRLNNPKYTRYAQTFTPDEGQIRIAPDDLAGLADQFERAAFQLAVGDVDNSMRLSLNYQSEIVDMVGIGSSDEAILFRILGSVPVRTVLEGALNLPQDMRSLDLDRQADILREQLSSKLGVRDLTDLTRLDKIDEVIKRYHAMNAIEQGPSPTTRGATALALLNSSIGVGSGASQNLFLSLLR